MVEMGTDRIHHALWDNMDPAHRFYEAGNKFENAIHDYYVEVDREIGELLKFADASTDVLVVSDHGAKRMDGGICVNEWLMANGYLALKENPESAVPLSKVKIDWSKTKAWGDGGYYARVFLNVAGREPEGTIAPEDYEKVRDELIAGLKSIRDEKGGDIGTQVYRPEELYQEVRGVAPDLIVYFGGLYWRSVGTVGGGKIHLPVATTVERSSLGQRLPMSRRRSWRSSVCPSRLTWRANRWRRTSPLLPNECTRARKISSAKSRWCGHALRSALALVVEEPMFRPTAIPAAAAF
jgi:predicted AlkP superfamily phosphohydrolase/phosphomutase